MSEQPTSQRSELIKFGIVALIAVVVVLVVALTRPFIFNRVVPAVLGEGETAVPVDDAYPAPDAAPAEADSSAPAEGVGGVGSDELEETAVEDPTPEETEATEPETPAIRHVVQPGETLFAIARIYDVTVDQLVAANNIANPNVVPVGTTLVIPGEQ